MEDWNVDDERSFAVEERRENNIFIILLSVSFL